MKSFWFLGLVASLAGCPQTRNLSETPQPAATADPLVHRLSLGAELISRAEHFLVARETAAEEVQLTGGCTLFRVHAALGLRDVDLELWTEAGERLLVDDGPDAEPALQLCGYTGAFFVRVRAYAGAGVATLFVFSSAEQRDLSQLGQGAATLDAAETPSPLSSATLSMLMSRGFTLMEKQVFRLDGLAVERPVFSGACYTATVEGSTVEMEAMVNGVVTARAIQNMVQWCVPPGVSASLRLRGEGETELWLYRAEPARVGGDAGLWLGDRSRQFLER